MPMKNMVEVDRLYQRCTGLDSVESLKKLGPFLDELQYTGSVNRLIRAASAFEDVGLFVVSRAERDFIEAMDALINQLRRVVPEDLHDLFDLPSTDCSEREALGIIAGQCQIVLTQIEARASATA